MMKKEDLTNTKEGILIRINIIYYLPMKCLMNSVDNYRKVGFFDFY